MSEFDILIRTILDATGGDLTIRQQKQIKDAISGVDGVAGLTVRQMRQLEAASKSAGGAALDAFKKIAPTATGPGPGFVSPVSAAAKVTEALDQSAPAAREAGGRIGQEAGEGMSHTLEHHLKTHLANMIGATVGASGLGRLAAIGVGGAMAAVGFAIAEKLKETTAHYFEQIDLMEEKMREFQNVADTLDPFAVTRDHLDQDTNAFMRSLSEIDRNAKTVNKTFAEMNELLLLRQKIAEEISDKELEKQIEQIRAKGASGKITSFQETSLIERAQREARDRKAVRDVDNAEEQKALKEQEARVAMGASLFNRDLAKSFNKPIADLQTQVNAGNKKAELNFGATFPSFSRLNSCSLCLWMCSSVSIFFVLFCSRESGLSSGR